MTASQTDLGLKGDLDAAEQFDRENPSASDKEVQSAVDSVKEIEKLGITYTPMGYKEPISLTLKEVHDYVARPTKSGQRPGRRDIVRFLKLCKARGLDPWVDDAYLVGYDTKDGPQFNLITSHQALLKRAELSETYAGVRSGVIVEKDGEIKYMPGEVHNGKLLGAWAEVFRNDRDQTTRVEVNLKAYDQNHSRWSIDKEGMICKCAEGKSLRTAFPASVGGMYNEAEDWGPDDRSEQPKKSGDNSRIKTIIPTE